MADLLDKASRQVESWDFLLSLHSNTCTQEAPRLKLILGGECWGGVPPPTHWVLTEACTCIPASEHF